MSFDTDASDVLTMWKARIDASVVLTALFGVGALHVHYPDIRLVPGKADDGTTIAEDALPGVVLYDEVTEAIRSGEGESEDAPGNAVSAVFYFDPDVTSIAKIETALGAFIKEQVAWTTEGLAIIRARKTRSTKPSRSQEAGADDSDGRLYATIAVVAWYS